MQDIRITLFADLLPMLRKDLYKSLNICSKADYSYRLYGLCILQRSRII